MDQIVRPAQSPPGVAESLGQPPRRRRWPLVLILFLLAAGAAAYFALGRGEQSVSYATTTVAPGDLTVEVAATGTLQPLIQTDVSSELSGVVRSVAVDENSTVKKGDVLAELDTVRLAALIERAEAAVKAAQAKVTQSQTTLDETGRALGRSTELSRRGMVTASALETATASRDRARADVAMSEANLAIARAELKQQEADLAKSKIYAPIDGVVLTRSVNPGQTVASSMQAPVLFVIAADLARMELKAAVDEADIGGVKAGQTARFTVDAYPDRKFDAAIRDISFGSVTTEGVVTYNARLDVDNRDLLLRPGMTATVAIVTRQAKGVLLVPSSAFRFSPPAAGARRGFSLLDLFGPPRPRFPAQRDRNAAAAGGRTLYVLREGTPQPVQVQTGASDGERTEITAGLEAGDQVVTGIAQAGGRRRGG